MAKSTKYIQYTCMQAARIFIHYRRYGYKPIYITVDNGIGKTRIESLHPNLMYIIISCSISASVHLLHSQLCNDKGGPITY